VIRNQGKDSQMSNPVKAMQPFTVLANPNSAAASSGALAELAAANLASEFYKILGESIKRFDDGLDQDKETGVRLVSFGESVTFHVEKIWYHDPSLIFFHGTTGEGQKVTLIQHVSQLSFLLVAMQKPDPAVPRRPIGFGHHDK
jgi:hypothetical protein